VLKKNLYLVDLQNLYKILKELKEYLDFNLTYVSNSDLIENLKKNQIDLKSSVYLASDQLQKDIQKLGIFGQTLFLTKDLVSIKVLFEKINISFLKLNYNFQSNIIIKNYKLNINSKLIINDTSSIKLTEKEVKMILYLFNSDKPVFAKELQKKIWHQKENLETHTVETHIYRLRKKFFDVFKDVNFIISDKMGYFIER
jgi:DNA-binding response OmpR family regulator